MPNQRQKRLDELTAEGLKLYPRSVLSAVTFQSEPKGKVWGMNGLGVCGCEPTGLSRLRALAPAAADAAAEKFAKWVSDTFPELYTAAVRRLENTGGAGGLSRLGQDTATAAAPVSAWDKVINAIQTIAPEYLKAKAQKDLLDVQLDRAKQGLPPLDMSQYAPSVRLGLDTQQIGGALASVPPVVWLGAGGVLLALLLIPRGRRR
jgi:hypothetical protein